REHRNVRRTACRGRSRQSGRTQPAILMSAIAPPSRTAMARRPPPTARDGRFGFERDRQIRTEIAQAAAKLIIEHGIDDWAHAKRKAARQLGVNKQTNLPSAEEIEQALREYNSLYRPQSQIELLHARRSLALVWMKLLNNFSPRLTAGVASGL